MVDVQKIKIVSILRPVNLPPSRAHLVVYEPSYKKDVPVPILYIAGNSNKISTEGEDFQSEEIMEATHFKFNSTFVGSSLYILPNY